MSCIFTAKETNFEVDQYLERSGLVASWVWHKGEPRSARVSASDILETSGLSVVLSEAEFLNPEQQLRDATEFLDRFAEALKLLAEFQGVQDAVLDFGIEDRDTGAQADYFPPRLLQLAGTLNVGLVVSRYPRNGS